MAWEDIVADRSGIGSVSFTLDSKTSEIANIINSLSKLSNELAENWKTSDGTANTFLNELQKSKEVLISYNNYLKDCKNSLQKVFDIYDELDNSYYENIKNII